MSQQQKMNIGTVIKRARIKLKMSADEVAYACNVTRSRVYSWEKEGYVFPKNLPALATVLQVSMRRLENSNGERPARDA